MCIQSFHWYSCTQMMTTKTPTTTATTHDRQGMITWACMPNEPKIAARYVSLYSLHLCEMSH